MITADPRPMSSAPLDGTPVRLFVFAGSAIASFWSAERSRKAFGAGDYRPGWYLLDDDAVELDEPRGWEPLAHDHFKTDSTSVSKRAYHVRRV
jgi:hypothetical protein